MLPKNSLLIIVCLIFSAIHSFAQTPTEAEAKAMADRIRHMTPDQMMKWRDSMTNAVMHHEAAVLPNGDQLLIKHKYDTGYAKVSFLYTKKYTGPGGSYTDVSSGTSTRAPMLFEANGHTVIGCSMNPFTKNTDLINRAADSMGRHGNSKTDEQNVRDVAWARQISFSSLFANNNSLKGTGIHSLPHETTKSVDNVAFFFEYDPVQNFSTIGAGADVTVWYHVEHRDTYGPYGIGCAAGTDPSLGKFVGAAQVPKDPDGAYAKVTKTKTGFKISYTKTTNFDGGGTVTETLTATIGEDDAEYEAVILPYQCQYEKWVPKGPNVDGSSNGKGDSSMRFKVVVREKNDTNRVYLGNYTVAWELRSVTNYIGICSNYPKATGNSISLPDLEFDSAQITNPDFEASTFTDHFAKTKTDAGSNSFIRIMSMDYGAWGELHATITLDNGSGPLTAEAYYEPGSTYLTIPFDKDGNKMADAWEKENDIYGKGYEFDWDDDDFPDNHRKGDNISLIDEYRGFLTQDESYGSVYQRLSPKDKELFTISQNSSSLYNIQYKRAIRDGAMGYAMCTGITVYHFVDDDYGQKEGGLTYGRWVNYNSPLPHHTQGVAIYISPTANPNNAESLASTAPLNDGGPGYQGGQPPSKTKAVIIWFPTLADSAVLHWYKPLVADTSWFRRGQLNLHIKHANQAFMQNMDTSTFAFTVASHFSANIGHMLSFTVAHEIGHATGVHHHHMANDDNGHGVGNCPMRYWFTWDVEGYCADWMPMFFAGKWDPSVFMTPDGTPMQFCKSDDNCFYQINLKE